MQTEEKLMLRKEREICGRKAEKYVTNVKYEKTFTIGQSGCTCHEREIMNPSESAGKTVIVASAGEHETNGKRAKIFYELKG